MKSEDYLGYSLEMAKVQCPREVPSERIEMRSVGVGKEQLFEVTFNIA
jgi:hypothetical protein